MTHRYYWLAAAVLVGFLLIFSLFQFLMRTFFVLVVVLAILYIAIGVVRRALSK